ncbi:MAG: ABC transporter permease [Clostridia bacterium]|nr:ABC transporter permease [Clostridia bacterium]
MILHIALKDLKIIFKDKKALMIMLLMPAIIMLILGSALGSVFTDELKINKFSIAVVNNDDGQMSQVFINKVLRESMGDMFNTFVVEGATAEKMLSNKTVPSIIVIPQNFSKNIDSNKPVNIEVKSQIDQQFKSSIVKSVTEGFAQGLSQSSAVAFAALDIFKKHNIPVPKPPMEGMTESMAIMQELQKKLSTEMIKFNESNEERQKNLSGIQYYSATMLVMFMLFGMSQGTKVMVEERESKTLGRIMSTRVGKLNLIMGKFLGLLFICFTQSMILIVFTRVVYGVNWGNSIPGLLLITFCAVFAGAALGMMIATIAKTPGAADGIGQAFIQVFTLIGGGMIPLFVMPDFVKYMANFTLNSWATKGYNDLMMGMGIDAILPYCGILIVMGMGYLSVGIARFKVE